MVPRHTAAQVEQGLGNYSNHCLPKEKLQRDEKNYIPGSMFYAHLLGLYHLWRPAQHRSYP